MTDVTAVWAADAARAIVDDLDGRVLEIEGEQWQADAPYLDRMDLLGPIVSRQVTIRLRVELIEGTLT